MKIKPPALKFAESVVAKMLPPDGAIANILSWLSSLKYSPRSVKPNHGLGSRLRYKADPHQLCPSMFLEPSQYCVLFTVPLNPMLNLSLSLAVTTASNWLTFEVSGALPPT